LFVAVTVANNIVILHLNYQTMWRTLVVWWLLQALAAGQNDTITSPPATTSDLFPPSGLDCYASPSGACLTAAYILASCLDYNDFIDDMWGCYCSNNYPSAWTA
jgi:hypothetical protein